jgi:hypothetical protein
VHNSQPSWVNSTRESPAKAIGSDDHGAACSKEPCPIRRFARILESCHGIEEVDADTAKVLT